MAKCDSKEAARPCVVGYESKPQQKTHELAEEISRMFGELSFDIMYQKAFTERIYELAISDGDSISIEAQAYALKNSLDKSSAMILEPLNDSVELLIERIKSMEASHD